MTYDDWKAKEPDPNESKETSMAEPAKCEECGHKWCGPACDGHLFQCSKSGGPTGPGCATPPATPLAEEGEILRSMAFTWLQNCGPSGQPDRFAGSLAALLGLVDCKAREEEQSTTRAKVNAEWCKAFEQSLGLEPCDVVSNVAEDHRRALNDERSKCMAGEQARADSLVKRVRAGEAKERDEAVRKARVEADERAVSIVQEYADGVKNIERGHVYGQGVRDVTSAILGRLPRPESFPTTPSAKGPETGAAETWGIRAWQNGAWHHWRGTAGDPSKPLETTETEARRIAAALNETAKELTDSLGWTYDAVPYSGAMPETWSHEAVRVALEEQSARHLAEVERMTREHADVVEKRVAEAVNRATAEMRDEHVRLHAAIGGDSLGIESPLDKLGRLRRIVGAVDGESALEAIRRVVAALKETEERLRLSGAARNTLEARCARYETDIAAERGQREAADKHAAIVRDNLDTALARVRELEQSFRMLTELRATNLAEYDAKLAFQTAAANEAVKHAETAETALSDAWTAMRFDETRRQGLKLSEVCAQHQRDFDVEIRSLEDARLALATEKAAVSDRDKLLEAAETALGEARAALETRDAQWSEQVRPIVEALAIVLKGGPR